MMSTVIERGVLSVAVMFLLTRAVSAVRDNPALQDRFAAAVGPLAYLGALAAGLLCFVVAAGFRFRPKGSSD